MAENQRAVDAVENHLKIGEFIESKKDAIFRRLEEQYNHVKGEVEAPLLFIAEALPLVSGIVQVGSTVESLRRSVRWANSCVPSADPGSFLSTLTLIYILEKGRDEFVVCEDKAKREVWNEMTDGVLRQMQYA
jgi:hypothetical protein